MIVFGDLRLWGILFLMMVALIIIAIVFKQVTGRDLDPPHDGA